VGADACPPRDPGRDTGAFRLPALRRDVDVGNPEPTQRLAERAWTEPRVFLFLDPLVSFSAAVATRVYLPALLWAAGLLLANCLLPRLFCSYLCPLGTCIDLFDRTAGRATKRLRMALPPRWTAARFGILAGVLAAAAAGTLLTGFVSPLPLFTRAVTVLAQPLQIAGRSGFAHLPPFGWPHFIALSLAAGALLLGLLVPVSGAGISAPAGRSFRSVPLLVLPGAKSIRIAHTVNSANTPAHSGALTPMRPHAR